MGWGGVGGVGVGATRGGGCCCCYLVLFVMVGHEREVAAAVAVATAAAAAAVSVASVPRRWASPLRLEGTVEPDFLPLLLLTGGWGREGGSSHREGSAAE